MCCCPQTYDEGGKVRLVPWRQKLCFPACDLWRHLGYTHDLPWTLGLRVEVDRVLAEEVHEAVVKKYNNGATTFLFCAAAFRPLVGKQYVAWRFIWPDTLVCAVKTAGCSVAAAGGGGEEAEEEEQEEEEEEEDAVPLHVKQRQQPHTASKRGATGTLADLEEARGPGMLDIKRQRLQVGRWRGGGVKGCMRGFWPR